MRPSAKKKLPRRGTLDRRGPVASGKASERRQEEGRKAGTRSSHERAPIAEAPADYFIERARRTDRAAIAALLRDAALPHEDFAAHLKTFLVARREKRVVGAVGAEIYGSHALLRSLVVAREERGRGLGGQLVNVLEQAARAWGVKRWWLLTATAEAFFAKRGFRVADRAEAPRAIRQTRQFQGGCGCAAVCFTRLRRAGRSLPR